jgi:hypothetical protein
MVAKTSGLFMGAGFTPMTVSDYAKLIRVCRIKAEPLSDKLFSHFEHD